VFIVLSTGVLANAVYVFGQGYSRGYISALGFDYSLFPTSWEEAPFWAYQASRMIGIHFVEYFISEGWVIYLYVAIGFIFIIYFLKFISVCLNKIKKYLTESNLKDSFPSDFHPAVKFFMFSFSLSYIATVAVFFIPIVLSVWVLFPYGAEKVGAFMSMKAYSSSDVNLCSTEYDWSGCLYIDAENFPGYKEKEKVLGKVIIKNDKYWGVLTENGPMTISAPDSIFYESIPLKKTED
jgi:hypothetical protein